MLPVIEKDKLAANVSMCAKRDRLSKNIIKER